VQGGYLPLFRAPRGTTDLLPAEQKYWRFIESSAIALAKLYGYNRIDTPVFEKSGLFIHSVGEGTDIVQKEMYVFEDRGGDSMTLRPEGTAPVCRAYLEHGMHNQPQPVRLYYFCPVFRYERPQAGRFREHHQFGVEALGDADPAVDAEIIEFAWQFVVSLGLRDCNLLLNNIGDHQCRPSYIEVLHAYYSSHKDRICADCHTRLTHNPLRLLDCKNEICRELGENAPRSTHHLCTACQEHWDTLLQYLQTMGIPYILDHRLVRGMDYYTRTVFEVQPIGGGSQSTICGGGRYDGLIQQLGGQPTPGIGFAAGIERLVINLKIGSGKVPGGPEPKYLVANVGDAARPAALNLAANIRRAGVGAILSSGSRALRGQMRQANALGIPYVAILGDEELQRGDVVIRNMNTSTQETMQLAEFISGLQDS
jgi:histidyl-tRNA synthetase